MGSGKGRLGDAQFKYFPVIPHKADRPQMRKVERLRAISTAAHNLSAFRVRSAPRNDRIRRFFVKSESCNDGLAMCEMAGIE